MTATTRGTHGSTPPTPKRCSPSSGSHHRAALTLRYLDGLPVPEVANHLGRTVHATEALLVRARTAFRHAYGEEVD